MKSCGSGIAAKEAPQASQPSRKRRQRQARDCLLHVLHDERLHFAHDRRTIPRHGGSPTPVHVCGVDGNQLQQAYVLDRHLQPVPVGVVGELYLGVANDILRLGIGAFPTASRKVEGLAGPQRTA